VKIKPSSGLRKENDKEQRRTNNNRNIPTTHVTPHSTQYSTLTHDTQHNAHSKKLPPPPSPTPTISYSRTRYMQQNKMIFYKCNKVGNKVGNDKFSERLLLFLAVVRLGNCVGVVPIPVHDKL
jgi:hypothetical protein